MGEIEEIQRKVIAFRDARDWKQFHNPKDIAISLVLEANELLEHFQWKDDEHSRKHLNENKAAVSDELADVLYWLLLIAYDFDIDLAEALDAKLKKNQSKYPVNESRGKSSKYTEYQS